MDYAAASVSAVDMDPVEIVRRQEMHKVARSIVDALWNDVDTYIMPLRMGNMYLKDVSETAITLLRDDIYDSTAIAAAQRMANAMHGSITNPSVKWRSRKFRAPAGKLNDEPQARDWLQGADEREWDELYDSNFDPEISSAYQDLVGGGNCFMSVSAENDSPKDWEGFNFIGMPLKECFFERDHRGDVYRFYRLLNWRATECKSMWPSMKLPDVIEKQLGEGGNPDQRFEIVYALYVRPGRSTSYYKAQAPTERAVGEQYVLKMTKERLGNIGGFYEMPVFHCPFERTTGSEWGHGPGMIMAPTAKYLNKWLEMEQMAIRKLVDPPNLVTERGLISDLDAQPGGMTVVRDLEKSIKPYLPDARIDFSKVSVEDLRKMIREAFHNDELQLKDSPQMSATEAQIRYELMNRVLGPTMGRIQTMLLSKILDRTFKTLLRNDQLGDIPQMVKDQKAQYKVIYTGALMRAQQSDQTAAIERWIGQVGAAAKVFPAVMNVVDIIQWARDLATKLDVPAKILRSTADVERMVQEQQKHAAGMAQQQMMAAQGSAKKAQGEGDKAMQEAAEGEQG
jgi:hypothetical protein